MLSNIAALQLALVYSLRSFVIIIIITIVVVVVVIVIVIVITSSHHCHNHHHAQTLVPCHDCLQAQCLQRS